MDFCIQCRKNPALLPEMQYCSECNYLETYNDYAKKMELQKLIRALKLKIADVHELQKVKMLQEDEAAKMPPLQNKELEREEQINFLKFLEKNMCEKCLRNAKISQQESKYGNLNYVQYFSELRKFRAFMQGFDCAHTSTKAGNDHAFAWLGGSKEDETMSSFLNKRYSNSARKNTQQFVEEEEEVSDEEAGMAEVRALTELLESKKEKLKASNSPQYIAMDDPRNMQYYLLKSIMKCEKCTRNLQKGWCETSFAAWIQKI